MASEILMVHDSGLCRWACAGVELTTMADAVRVAWLVVVTEFSALVDRHGTRGCRKGDLAGQICLGWSVASSTPCWQRARCPPANPACHGSPCVELAACKASAVASWMPRPASAPAARRSTHQCARSSIRPAAVDATRLPKEAGCGGRTRWQDGRRRRNPLHGSEFMGSIA